MVCVVSIQWWSTNNNQNSIVLIVSTWVFRYGSGLKIKVERWIRRQRTLRLRQTMTKYEILSANLLKTKKESSYTKSDMLILHIHVQQKKKCRHHSLSPSGFEVVGFRLRGVTNVNFRCSHRGILMYSASLCYREATGQSVGKYNLCSHT